MLLNSFYDKSFTTTNSSQSHYALSYPLCLKWIPWSRYKVAIDDASGIIAKVLSMFCILLGIISYSNCSILFEMGKGLSTKRIGILMRFCES